MRTKYTSRSNRIQMWRAVARMQSKAVISMSARMTRSWSFELQCPQSFSPDRFSLPQACREQFQAVQFSLQDWPLNEPSFPVVERYVSKMIVRLSCYRQGLMSRLYKIGREPLGLSGLSNTCVISCWVFSPAPYIVPVAVIAAMAPVMTIRLIFCC